MFTKNKVQHDNEDEHEVRTSETSDAQLARTEAGPLRPETTGRDPGRSVFFVARRTVREFLDDRGTDLAASLTYYAVLAIFPGVIALLSLVGVLGQAQTSVSMIEDVLRPLVSADLLRQISGPLEELARVPGAGVALLVGLLGALWSASGYVGAFSRAMNTIYEVEEGRPFWRLRPMQLLVTLATVVLSAVALIILIVSGPVAEAVGNAIGLGDNLVVAWSYAKWPVLAVVVMVVVALLYHSTPNVKFAKFRVITVGAFVAILVWLAASVGFAFFVANFSSYNTTYGSLAGVVVFLLWLWITNVALVFGAELDAELERGRELKRGLAAEEHLQLPVRADRGIAKAQERRDRDVATQRDLRLTAAGRGDPADRPFGRR